ncbi:MAG: adenylate kinase, partial [Acidimicrobiia bacterium]|nr:adenylate kinase [Acidimicrobiia bacterium]
GSGKSTFGRRVAERLGCSCVELDALHHLADWQPRDPDEFAAAVADATPADGRWVVEGNYRQVTMEGVVWQRADTVVVYDLPRRVVMSQLVRRTVRRWVRREELWNGNRESLRNMVSRDPELNVVLWSWTHYDDYAERYQLAGTDPRWVHLEFVYLTSHAEADAWLDALIAD